MFTTSLELHATGALTHCQTLVQKFLYSTVYRKKTKNDLMFTSRDLVKLQKINKSSLQKRNFFPHMTVSLYMSYQSLKGSQTPLDPYYQHFFLGMSFSPLSTVSVFTYFFPYPWTKRRAYTEDPPTSRDYLRDSILLAPRANHQNKELTEQMKT